MKGIGQARSPYIDLGKSTCFDAVADNMDFDPQIRLQFSKESLRKILFLPRIISLNFTL